eukprot:CAMPEP_0172189034 /NCGR_PEP_ID=MMETSP1050-20130122/22286_1 /TAXON_ID=233186 /ORGANISM="Cryptomonas curvata, Strain CCAP979/52" /LENGTH=458 /DNA_ID=CAMNT_0012863657 /DNA_START=303 /DNA_END=1679 /DNA_ORIENTATION=+
MNLPSFTRLCLIIIRYSKNYQERREILGLKIFIAAAFLGLALCIFSVMQLNTRQPKLLEANPVHSEPSNMDRENFKVLSSAAYPSPQMQQPGYAAGGYRQQVYNSNQHNLYQSEETEDDADPVYQAQPSQAAAAAHTPSYPPQYGATAAAAPQYAPSQQYNSAPQPVSQYAQPPPAQGYAQPSYTNVQPAYSAAAPAAAAELPCTPCLNPACSSSTGAGGCYRPAPASPGFVCECPPAVESTPPPAPAVGSLEWKELPGNKYGDEHGLAISAQDSTDGVLTAGYESGQVAYQLSRYLRQHAKGAKLQAQIEDIILKDLYSVQPCKLVPGGPGGYRCANSDDDEGDVVDQLPGAAGSAAETSHGGAAKSGVLGLGFMGLKSTQGRAQALSQSQSKPPPLTLEQAQKLEAQIAVLREDAWALPTSIQADLEELRHATQRYEAAQDKGSLGLGINILGLKI